MGLDIRGYYGVKLVGIREATDQEQITARANQLTGEVSE